MTPEIRARAEQHVEQLYHLASELARVQSPGYFYALSDEARSLIANINAGKLPKMGEDHGHDR